LPSDNCFFDINQLEIIILESIVSILAAEKQMPPFTQHLIP
jgi:hypothetical protein